VTYNVTALFVQAQALNAQADALQREIDALEVTRQNLELALKIGRAPEVDLLKVLDRIGEAEAARMNTLAQRQRLLAALMSLLGRDPAQTPTLAPVPDRLPELVAGKSEMQDAAVRRSSIRAAELSAAQGEQQIGVARSALGPTVSVQASYLQNADLSSVDTSGDTWSIGVQVAAPIFDGGSRRADLSRSREEAKALQQRAMAARLEAMADLEGALASWQSAQDQLRAADAQYSSAHEVARIEQVRFDTGAGDIEDLLRARSREVAAQSAQIAARAQIIVSGAQINRVTESEAAR
jgi:outer membrane protein TolC